MASDRKGCRDWRPLIRSRCKGVLKKNNEWKEELSCVTYAEFGGDWSSWSEFTAVFLRWISRAASLECPTGWVENEDLRPKTQKRRPLKITYKYLETGISTLEV